MEHFAHLVFAMLYSGFTWFCGICILFLGVQSCFCPRCRKLIKKNADCPTFPAALRVDYCNSITLDRGVGPVHVLHWLCPMLALVLHLYDGQSRIVVVSRLDVRDRDT